MKLTVQSSEYKFIIALYILDIYLFKTTPLFWKTILFIKEQYEIVLSSEWIRLKLISVLGINSNFTKYIFKFQIVFQIKHVRKSSFM